MANVSLSEFAGQIGRSKALVSRMVNDGRIPRNADGSIPLEKALKAFDEYQNAPKNRGGRPSKASKAAEVKRKPEKKKSSAVKHTPIEEVETVREEKRQNAADIHAALNKAKLADRTFQARLRELDFKMKSGELLLKTEVEESIALAVANFQAKMRGIPPRISSMCEGRIAREIEEIISDAIEQTFSELKKLQDSYKSSE